MQGIPQAVRELIGRVRQSGCGTNLVEMFERCIVNTWQTTVEQKEDGSWFVITGDIPAMWLRDSSMQLFPYLRAVEDSGITAMFEGVIRRQAVCILTDAYANAFNAAPEGKSFSPSDRTDKFSPWVWERKFELDSLCFPLWIAARYARAKSRWTVFDDTCRRAYELILDVMETEQHHMQRSPYFFERESPLITETLPCEGKGAPVGYTGMVWSGFRPSDDACTYGYLIPSNMLASVVLEDLRDINRHTWRDENIERRAAILGAGIQAGIERYGVQEHGGRRIYCYETDGLDHFNWMDDANYPSLLSASFFGYCEREDELYQNTRSYVLSEGNPYYFAGEECNGIGSPHTPDGYIWPLGLIMQGLTSSSFDRRCAIIEILLRTDAGTGYIHESFSKDNASHYTRPWFAWANSMFCELVMRTYLDEAPPSPARTDLRPP